MINIPGHTISLHDLRQNYGRSTLDESDLDPDPIAQFSIWFEDAVKAGLHEPNAMTLATSTPDGRPSARIVLLKGLDARGFVFYTNYQSRKGREIEANPFVSLVFLHHELERQVRVEGKAERVTAEESDEYYLTRPIGSQLGAWASEQGEVVADRATLDRRLAETEARTKTESLTRPPHWGGYRVIPSTIEFWQGRRNRMHDRLRYRLSESGWVIERLEP